MVPQQMYISIYEFIMITNVLVVRFFVLCISVLAGSRVCEQAGDEVWISRALLFVEMSRYIYVIFVSLHTTMLHHC